MKEKKSKKNKPDVNRLSMESGEIVDDEEDDSEMERVIKKKNKEIRRKTEITISYIIN